MFENNPIIEGLKKLYFEFRLTLRLLRDRRVPLWSKVIPVAAFAYVLMPFDIIPDFILVIGQLDDLTILYAAFRFFRQFSPPHVVDEHAQALITGQEKAREDVVEVKNYRIRQK
jgi:uncharacterized membrane protein YkvA (DUF1232 family)